jgi:hypothetical protein
MWLNFNKVSITCANLKLKVLRDTQRHVTNGYSLLNLRIISTIIMHLCLMSNDFERWTRRRLILLILILLVSCEATKKFMIHNNLLYFGFYLEIKMSKLGENISFLFKCSLFVWIYIYIDWNQILFYFYDCVKL